MFPMYDARTEPKVYCKCCEYQVKFLDNVVNVDGYDYCSEDCVEEDGFVKHAMMDDVYLPKEESFYVEDVGYFEDINEAKDYGYVQCNTCKEVVAEDNVITVNDISTCNECFKTEH